MMSETKDDSKDLDEAQKNQKKAGAAENDPETTWPAENLREEAAEMVDEEERSNDPMSPENIKEHKPSAVKRDKNEGSTGDPV
jgi:hypothetical protein